MYELKMIGKTIGGGVRSAASLAAKYRAITFLVLALIAAVALTGFMKLGGRGSAWDTATHFIAENPVMIGSGAGCFLGGVTLSMLQAGQVLKKIRKGQMQKWGVKIENTLSRWKEIKASVKKYSVITLTVLSIVALLGVIVLFSMKRGGIEVMADRTLKILGSSAACFVIGSLFGFAQWLQAWWNEINILYETVKNQRSLRSQSNLEELALDLI